MTLAFTFRIKNAWVVVADRKLISKDDNIKDRDSLHIKFFTDNITKIKEISYNLIFIGSGRRDILDKAIERINLSKDFQEVLDYPYLKINEIYSDFGSEIDLEEFLIIDKDNEKGFKFKIKEIKESEGRKGVYELNGLELENNFIGTYESVNIGNVKIDIAKLKQNILKNVGKKFYKECGRLLSIVSLDNLYSIGHPQIHGFDTWIISKDKIKKIYADPSTTYNYEVKEK